MLRDDAKAEPMGISAFVFDERVAPAGGELWDWIRAQRAAAREGEWQRPETSSNILKLWFGEMRESFPLIEDSDPDDLRGTEYCFFKDLVEIVFAGPVGEEGVVTAWKLACKHGLRMLVGDELASAVRSRRGKTGPHNRAGWEQGSCRSDRQAERLYRDPGPGICAGLGCKAMGSRST
jgi:hypothetical protein